MTNTTKFHAIMLPITKHEVDRPAVAVPGATPFHHTQHRTLAAAARSLSKGFGNWTRARSAPSIWCGIVTPDGEVMSLRQAQGKSGFVSHPPLENALRAAAGFRTEA